MTRTSVIPSEARDLQFPQLLAPIRHHVEDPRHGRHNRSRRRRRRSRRRNSTVRRRSAPLAGFTGTRRVPPPMNEPVKSYAPGSPERAALKARLKEMANERIDIPIIIGGKEIRTGDDGAGGDAARPPARARRLAQGVDASTSHAGDRRGARTRAPSGRNWAWEDRAAVFLRAAELLATTWRADAERGDDARPVEDGVPGRDRRGVRADRLLALQSGVRAGAVRRAAAVEQHDVEPARLSAARGIRLRGDAVQLHVDRRQPADRAGADGQHGDLEAGVDARCSRRTTS